MNLEALMVAFKSSVTKLLFSIIIVEVDFKDTGYGGALYLFERERMSSIRSRSVSVKQVNLLRSTNTRMCYWKYK